MAFRFHRTLGVLPGLKLNFSKSGISVSAGIRDLHYTVGSKGTPATVELPDSGLSHTDYHRYAPSAASSDGRGWFWGLFFPSHVAPAQDRAPAEYSELDAWKRGKRLEIEPTNLTDPATNSDNVLTGMKIWIERFEQAVTNLEYEMKQEGSLDEFMMATSKYCFLIQSNVAEPLKALNFIAVITADGGKNIKEDVIEVFTQLMDILEGQNDNIKKKLKSGVPTSRVWSGMRPRGRANITTPLKKILGALLLMFEPGKFTIEWKVASSDAVAA
jgi:Protein of unknown function (DUF4236)